jgi:hypothetical protein
MNDLCIYPSRTTPPKGKGMQLGRKAKVNTFLDALATEQVSQVPTIDQENLPQLRQWWQLRLKKRQHNLK